MNKVITDGLELMPPKFREGLNVWSSGDGTPGSDTYAGSGPGAFVPADSTFSGCLEVMAFEPLVRVRYMGVTPILPGCYLRVSARIKVVSGGLPQVRIAGTPLSGTSVISGESTAGPSVSCTGYGEVMEVSAIIGSGQRQGVDLVWESANGGHIGLDIVSTGMPSMLRIDDLKIEDVTNVFLRDMLGLVDVRDYGALGDGTTDDSAAFVAADNAANGREVLVSAGTYRLNQDVTMSSQVRFEGRVVMPSNKHLILQRNFDYSTYLDAFRDEEEAFRKAWQALLNYSDHNVLDLGGRRVSLTAPIDMRAAEGGAARFETRRVIQNGELNVVSGAAWNPRSITSSATYNASQDKVLTNVTNIANVEAGSLVTGSGVGREVYVKSVDLAGRKVTLSQPLYDAEGTQTYTFTRFRYMLDFSGFEKHSNLVLKNIHFGCDAVASGIMLARDGFSMQIVDCRFARPRDRAITSAGRACQDLIIDRCQFVSKETSLRAQDRSTLVFNSNANDVKIRNCRIVRFRHFCVLGGTGSLITGNHWFHGDDETNGVRLGGLIVAQTNPKTIITGNYIDNNSIEWTNEYETDPAMGVQYSFGGLTITGNIFTAKDVAHWFRWIVIKPYGPGHFVHGLSVTGNVFRTVNGAIDRIEHVDTTFADLNRNSMRNVVFDNNVFHGVSTETKNPLSVVHNQTTASSTWTLQTDERLPFDAWTRKIEAIAPEGTLKNGSGQYVFAMPGVRTQVGSDKDQVQLVWPEPTRGQVRCKVRIDNPN